MARPSTPQGSLRQRNVPGKAAPEQPSFAPEAELDKLAKAAAQRSAQGKERDYQLGLLIITALAFVTRFWGISHPNEVVFDEVHFGKVIGSSETLWFALSLTSCSSRSLLPSISSEHTSSMSTRLLANCSSPSWGG